MASRSTLKNVTLTADEETLERAKRRAAEQQKTLNAVFREWLEQYACDSSGGAAYDALMKDLSRVSAGRKFSRDEINER